jgi:hypothetical protein
MTNSLVVTKGLFTDLPMSGRQDAEASAGSNLGNRTRTHAVRLAISR